MSNIEKIDRDQILSGIYQVIDEINETFQKKENLEKKESTSLIGNQSTLDSLGLVHLISGIEDWIEEAYDIVTVVADENSVSGDVSPFKTVSTLAEHILAKLDKEMENK